MNVRKQETRPIWSPEEEALLVEHYPGKPTNEILHLFPGRNEKSIRVHAGTMNLKKTDYDYTAARQAALRKAQEAKDWSPEEDAVVIEHYPRKTSPEDMLKLLPKRNWNSIKRRASQLRVTKPHMKTGDLEDLIRQEYPIKGKALAAELGYGEKYLRKIACELGVKGPAVKRAIPKRRPRPEGAHVKPAPSAKRAIGKGNGFVPFSKPEVTPWYREPHHSDAYKQGLANHLAGKKKTLFIDANGRQAVAYKQAA